MMRRVDLLPAAYAARRRERRNLAAVIVAGVLVLLLLIGWYFLIGLRIADAREDLQTVQTENAQLQAEIDELARFAQLDREVREKRTALQLAMAGDIDWPALLTEVAMVVPGEVWLESLTASGNAEGAAEQVVTETAVVDIRPNPAFGRITFTGNALSMPGVAKWLIRLGGVEEFAAIWLTNATAEEAAEGTGIVNFNSTLELAPRAGSGRFQGGRP